MYNVLKAIGDVLVVMLVMPVVQVMPVSAYQPLLVSDLHDLHLHDLQDSKT